MEDIKMYVIAIQWGIFFAFILINMLIGFKRGFKKTSYYTVVSIALTLLLMFGISFITIDWFFSGPVRLVDFVGRFVDIPDNVKSIVTHDKVSPLLYVVIDTVLKIVIFIVLYPIIKRLLTALIFKPIYKNTIGKNDKIKKPHLGSRLGGSLVGAVRGVFVAVMILLPVIVLAGAFNQYDDSVQQENPTSNNNNHVLIDSEGTTEEQLEQLDEMMDIIRTFHNEGLGNALSSVKFAGKSVDRHVFDLMFTSRVKDINGNKTKVKMSEELDSLGLIIQVLVEKGYLEEGFDFKQINYDDHYSDIEKMIEALGNSTVLNLAVPIALEVLYDEGYITKELGFDVKEIEHAESAYNALKNFSLKDELETISNTLKEVLLVGNIEELIELGNNPELVNDLTPKQKESISNILAEISNLQVLNGTNIAIEYLLNDEKVLNEITWDEDPYGYLVSQLDFILNNENFLNEELLSISVLVENLLKEDFDSNNFVDENGKFDPQALLLEGNESLVNAAMDGIGSLGLVVNGIPIGVDYLLYTSKNTSIQQLADEISEIAKDQNYGNEIDNINDIYSIAVALGVSQYFNKEDALVVTDRILSTEKGFENVELIIKKIFEDSKAINDVLELASEPILEAFIKNQEILDLALLVVSNEEFVFGTEIVNLINTFKPIYNVEDISLTRIRQIVREKDYASLAHVFADMEEEGFKDFKTSLLGLQTIQYASKEIAEFGKSKLNNNFLVIPDNANYDSIKYDLNKLLDLAYEAATVIKTENLTTAEITNINIAQVIDLDKVTALLNFDYAEDEAVLKNSILLNSLIDNIVRRNNTNLGSFGTISLPEGLDRRAVTEDWVDEINLIIGGVFNVVDAFSGEDEEFILSINNLRSIKGLKDIPADVGVRFADEDLAAATFTDLLTSRILTNNIYSVALEQLDKFKIPNDIMSKDLEDALKDGNNFVELINIFAEVMEQAITEKGSDISVESLDSAVRSINLHKTFDIFNNIGENVVVKLANNAIVNNAFREAAVHEYIQNQAYKFINGAKIPAPLNTVTEGIFEYTTALDDKGRLKEETLEELFLLTKELKLPGNMLKLPGSEVVSTLTTAFSDDKIDGLIEIDFMHNITSNILLLDQMKEFIGNSAGFDYNDLTLSYTEKDEKNNMTKEEVSDVFKGILSIGLGNFNNLSITTLKEADIDVLLTSNYLYEVLDLTVKAQIDDIPVEALEPEGDEHEGLLRKEEFEGMIETLDILELDNPNDLNADNISINQLQEVINVDSFLVKKLISDQIIEFIEVPESSITNGIISDTELQNIVDTLLIINDNGEAKLSSLDSNNITLTRPDLEEMLNLDSRIVDRLISTEIIKLISEDVLVGLLENDDKDVIRIHLLGLNTGLLTLGLNDDLSGNIEPNDLEMDNLILVTETNAAVIINRLISKSVESSVNDEDVIAGTKEDGFITHDELNQMFKDLKTLNIDDVENEIDPNSEDITIDQLIAVTGEDNSVIVNRLIAKSVEDSINDDDVIAGTKEDGFINRSEVNKLFINLKDLKQDKVTDEINSELLDVEDLIIVTEDGNSIIINRLIAESVKLNLDPKVPSSIVNNGYIERIEVNKLFKALKALSVDDIQSLEDSNFVSIVTFDEIISANNIESILFRVQLSEQLIDSELVTTNAKVVLDGIDVIEQEELERFFAASSGLDESIETVDQLINYIEDVNNYGSLFDKYQEMKDEPDKSIILVDTIKTKLGIIE